MCMCVRVVSELLAEVRQYMDCLYKLSECVAMLDMLVGFAHNCTLSEYGGFSTAQDS